MANVCQAPVLLFVIVSVRLTVSVSVCELQGGPGGVGIVVPDLMAWGFIGPWLEAPSEPL